MRTFLNFISIIFFSLISFSAIGQEKASITIKTTGTVSPLNQYLFNTYGVEQTESILLNISDYQSKNNVLVLFNDDYQKQINLLDEALLNATTLPEKEAIEKRKNKIIDFKTIETIVAN